MNNGKDCLFCLLDKPNTKKNIAPCDCAPFLHQRCLNKWYKTNPNSCPICRINYEDIGSPIEEEAQEDPEIMQNYIRNDFFAKRFSALFISIVLFSSWIYNSF